MFLSIFPLNLLLCIPLALADVEASRIFAEFVPQILWFVFFLSSFSSFSLGFSVEAQVKMG